MGVLTRELSALYRAELSGEEPRLPALPVQYADYAVWQRRWLQGEELEAQLDYWRRQLAELPPLNLPTDYPRPAVQTFDGRAQHFQLGAGVVQSLARLSRQEGATLFMTGFAAFVTLLHRYTGQDDIAVGTPVANRDRAETENLIGFFVNTLVLRADLAGNPTFRELLRRVRETALGAYEHQEMPFDLLVEHLRPERQGDYTPFFQVCYEMKNERVRASESPGLPPAGGEDNHQGTAHFDLTLSLRATPESLGGYLEYSTALFEPDTAAEIVRRYAALLESVAADPEQRLLDIPLGAEEAAGSYAPAFDPAGHADDQFIFN
jgi:non-ribosomal peptide synthetase component F